MFINKMEHNAQVKNRAQGSCCFINKPAIMLGVWQFRLERLILKKFPWLFSCDLALLSSL